MNTETMRKINIIVALVIGLLLIVILLLLCVSGEKESYSSPKTIWRKLRDDKCYGRDDIEKILNLVPGTYEMIEKGEVEPDTETAERLRILFTYCDKNEIKQNQEDSNASRPQTTMPSRTMPGRPQTTMPVRPQTTMPGRSQTTMPGRSQTTMPGRAQTTRPGRAQTTLPGRPQTTMPGRPQTTMPSRPQTMMPGRPQTTTMPGRPQTTMPGRPQTTMHGRPQTTMPGRPQTTIPGTTSMSGIKGSNGPRGTPIVAKTTNGPMGTPIDTPDGQRGATGNGNGKKKSTITPKSIQQFSESKYVITPYVNEKYNIMITSGEIVFDKQKHVYEFVMNTIVKDSPKQMKLKGNYEITCLFVIAFYYILFLKSK